MNDFLVHIYIENNCFIDTLSSLYERAKDLTLVNERVKYHVLFPVFVDDGDFMITEKKQVMIYCNDERITSKKIEHGDMITVKEESGQMYHMLFQKMCHFSLNTKIYKISEKITFGRAKECDVICSVNQYVARKLAVLEKKDKQLFIFSNGFGVYLNNEIVKDGTRQEVHQFDQISCMGIQCIVLDQYTIAISSNAECHLAEQSRRYSSQSVSQKELFTRYPRIYSSLHTDTITIDSPTTLPQIRKMPFILQVGPTMTMSLAMIATIAVSLQNNTQSSSVYSSMVMAGTMLVSALLWPFLSRRYEKVQYRNKLEERKTKYLAYIQNCDNKILSLYQENQEIWNHRLFPSLKECLERLQYTKRELWVRNCQDEDFLAVRLGLGQKPFEVSIMVPNDKFTLDDDDLIQLPKAIQEKYQMMEDVPIVLSLMEHRAVGVVGEGQQMYLMANQILSQLVYHYSADDLKIVIISYNNSFSWILNFPHLWNFSKSIRFTASNKKEVREVFDYIEQEIAQKQEKELQDFNHYVFIIEDLELIEGETLTRYLLQESNEVNFHALYLSQNFSSLPSCASAIVQYDSTLSTEEKYGLYEKNKNNNILQLFKCDSITFDNLTDFMSFVDSCQFYGEDSLKSIPERIQFLDMYEAANTDMLPIASNWERNSSHQSLAVPIGVNQNGELFYLDIHEKYHGCHGLVAGTTGSGKSEFLQGLILSLMIHFSSKDISFVVIDFKGGDMARPFLNTPHLSATISNLSTSVLYRAEVSLEAEIKRRQKIFNEEAVNLGIDKIDINVYQRLYKEGRLNKALPHLVIIVDEFAQLKSQCLEFMSKLIDIAQVGRSLGIHLILATQKPSGVVDPQIASNSRFKVCLKVSDKEDSVDVIHRPDAAYIKQPGRACIQIGYDEINDVIQSGFAGAPYIKKDHFIDESEISAYMVSHAAQSQRSYRRSINEEKTGETQIEAIVKRIRELAEKLDYQSYSLWLPPLADLIASNQLPFSADNDSRQLCAPLGLIDDIYNQKQPILNMNLQGNIAIYGSGGSGKSTMLQTILIQFAINYSPQQFQYLLIDMGSRSFSYLKNDPHCEAVVFGDDSNQISELFDDLNQEINQRKILFERNNVSSYKAYKDQCEEILPFKLVVIENYSQFRESYFEYEEKLIDMMSSADNYGLCFLLTANSSNTIHYKVSNHIAQKFVFYMNDSNDYLNILNKKVPFELEQKPGRGFMIYEKRIVEFQTAVLFGELIENLRVERILKLFDQQRSYEKKQSNQGHEKYATKKHPLFDAPFSVAEVNNRRCGFDFMYGNALICGMDMEKELTQALACENKNVYVVDPNNEIKCDRDRHINKAEEFSSLLAQMRQSKDKFYLLVYGFDAFYRMLKNEDVYPFSNLIDEKERIHIITVETMRQIKRYFGLPEPLHKKMMYCQQGMIVGLNPTIEICTLLNDSLYKSIGKLSEIQKEEGWLFLNEQCIRVKIKESVKDDRN